MVGEAGTGLELLTFLSSYRRMPLLVILDLSMPGLSGFETLQKIKEGYPEVKVLILSRHKEEAYLQRAISSQAEGYVVKEDAGTELLPAIEKIQQGGQYISTSFSRNRALPEELK